MAGSSWMRVLTLRAFVSQAALSLARQPAGAASNLHVDRRQRAVRDGAAHCAGEGEARVQVKAAQFARRLRRRALLQRVDADRARAGRGGSRCHCCRLVLTRYVDGCAGSTLLVRMEIC